MMQIYDDILETMGDTPLVRLRRFHPLGAALAAKIEYFNPGGSVKDRIGGAMIDAGERAGLLRPGGTIVEPTSGNT
jgi:cysteine synthase